MSEVQWLGSTKELRNYVKAEKAGQTGVEFQPKKLEEAELDKEKEIVVPEGTPKVQKKRACQKRQGEKR